MTLTEIYHEDSYSVKEFSKSYPISGEEEEIHLHFSICEDPTEKIAILEEILVPRPLRGKGHGTRALQKWLEEMRDEGVERIFLIPFPLESEEATSEELVRLFNFYRRFGFEFQVPDLAEQIEESEADEIWNYYDLDPGDLIMSLWVEDLQ